MHEMQRVFKKLQIKRCSEKYSTKSKETSSLVNTKAEDYI